MFFQKKFFHLPRRTLKEICDLVAVGFGDFVDEGEEEVEKMDGGDGVIEGAVFVCVVEVVELGDGFEAV